MPSGPRQRDLSTRQNSTMQTRPRESRVSSIKKHKNPLFNRFFFPFLYSKVVPLYSSFCRKSGETTHIIHFLGWHMGAFIHCHCEFMLLLWMLSLLVFIHIVTEIIYRCVYIRNLANSCATVVCAKHSWRAKCMLQLHYFFLLISKHQYARRIRIIVLTSSILQTFIRM